MATVPVTVNSIREQIREAIKLNLSVVGTPLATPTAWNTTSDKTKYPLSKAVFATSGLLSEHMGSRDMREDVLYVEVAPWNTADSYELATSKIMESYRPYFATQAVQVSMDPTYAPSLGKIKVTAIDLILTDLQNPYAVVRFTLLVDYLVQG